MKSGELVERLVAALAVVLLVGGALLVLAPFAAALVWGAILAYTTWMPYKKLSAWLGGRSGLAATLMVVLIFVLVLGPFVIAGFGFAAHVDELGALLQRAYDSGLPDLPAWIVGLPLVGAPIQEFWSGLTQTDSELIAQLRKLAAPAGKFMLTVGAAIGQGLLLLALSIVLAFFFYTGGDSMVIWLRSVMLRVGGEHAHHLLALTGNTVKGVVYGILGTALAQGILAGIGFWVAGVPGAAVLGFATFFLSVVPGGPALLWIPAALWLYHGGSLGWAIFIAVWGLGVVGMADNVMKPMIISKGSDMPFILVMLGVLGGALAFGLLGVFIGPTLLAVSFTLIRHWAADQQALAAVAAKPSAGPEKPPAAARVNAPK
jgi:predicted PurR-regulated permease PerM